MSSVNLKDVNKYYYSAGQLVHAVQNLNMCIADGEFVAIVGPSGCGKSSTMRMIAGLEGITSGTLEFDGKVVNHLPASERNVALSFESYALYQHMTVRENIAFCLKMKKLKDEEIKKKTDWIISLLGIEAICDYKPSNLSGGQSQLVSLARALVRQPAVTLLDEPISHLDRGARQDVSMKIRELHNNLGLTMIYVTHNQEEAFALADRIAVMDGGRLLQIGRREEILDDPRDMFVAEFVGEPSMNFIHCNVTHDNGEIRLISKNKPMITLPFNGDPAVLISKEIKEVTVGVRPIDCHLNKQSDSIQLSGEVHLYEHLGENAIVRVCVGDYSIAVDIDPSIKVAIGEKVTLGFNSNRLYYFDSASGKSINHLDD